MSRDRGPVCAVTRRAFDTPPGVTTEVWDGTTRSLQDIFERFQPDHVLHLAAHYVREHAREDVVTLVDANVGVAAQVLECSGPAAVVLATTHFMHYGRSMRALNLYAATKLAMLDVARYYGDARQTRWAAVTFYDVYGPHDTRRKLVEVAVEASLADEPLAVPADDPEIRLLYVDDAVGALHAAADALDDDTSWSGTEFFAAPASSARVRDVLAAVADVTGGRPAIAAARYPSSERSIRTPTDPGPPPPGWEPQVTLADGIKAIVESRSQ